MAKKRSRRNFAREVSGKNTPSFNIKESPSISASKISKLISNNQLIHNVNYRNRQGPQVNMGLNYSDLAEQNRLARFSDMNAVESGLMSRHVARSKDRIRQMRVYELLVKQGKAGGGVLETMELAKAFNAIAQERGLIAESAEVTLAVDKQFLKGTILGSSKTDKDLAAKLIKNIEELKAGKIPKGIQPWLKAWKDPTELKIRQETRGIKASIERLGKDGRELVYSGRGQVASYEAYKEARLNSKRYGGSKITQGLRIADYSMPLEDIFLEGERRLGIQQKVVSMPSAGGKLKLPKGLGKYALALTAAAGAGFILDRTFKISGDDDDYNTIEGLNHGWFGQTRKQTTDFGSGFHMDRINRMSSGINNPLELQAIEQDRKRLQDKAQKEIGSFSEMDLMMINDRQTLEGINQKRKQLREVKLSDYQVMIDDADTLVLNKKGSKDVTIRLSGIDAAETKHGSDPLEKYRIGQAQPLGDVATDRLKELMGDKKDLRLFVDPTQKTYGRYLGLIYKGNTNLNLQLVKEGAVSSLEFGAKYKDISERSAFMAAGDKAEREGAGIWGDDFFKDWKAFSAGAGRDQTFNSFTDILRLAKNKHLARGAELMWEDGTSPEESYRAGQLYQMSNQFSSKDDQYNTIGGMKHGWFGKTRNKTTDFGSGYKGPTEYEDPTPLEYGKLALTGAVFAGSYHLWDKPINIFGGVDIDSLSYMGLRTEEKLTSQVLNRTKATYGDLVYNALRRSELSLGGMPKAFSLSTLMSPSILKDMTIEVDLAKSAFDPVKLSGGGSLEPGIGSGYKDHLMQLTGKDAATFDRYNKVLFEKNKLYGITADGTRETLLEEARAFQRIHDPSITTSATQFTKAYEGTLGTKGIGKEHATMIGGGHTKRQAAFRTAHAYAVESFSKYLRLLDDPAKAIRDVFPNVSPKFTGAVEKATKYVPRFGVGGESKLIGTLPQLLGRHAKKALPLLIGLPAIFQTLNWATRQIAPEDSVAGQAGITGILAETARVAHMTYASVSEATGLTELRRQGEEIAPGLTGIQPLLGFALSGFITGAAVGMGSNVYQEARAESGIARHAEMAAAKTVKSPMSGFMSRIPGMRGNYTKTIKYGIKGAALMSVLALPFAIMGLGASQTTAELDEEYLGGKEVAIKKARWWEFGMTPWEGDKTMYYRPNWYNRTLDRPTDKSIYQGEDISPVGKFIRGLMDPYWLEKKQYEDRPYPIAGSSGEGLGIFAPLYEWTIGRVLKPPAFMHVDEMPSGGYKSDTRKYAPSMELGGLPAEEAITPYSLQEQAKQQFYNAYEALGLRGFVGSAIKEAFTGEQDLSEFTPILQSSSDIESSRRAFWDLNLGGLGGTTEAYRRFTPKRPYTTEYVNPLKNKMPDWLPGEDYFINFKTGDPFTKLAEGEYRLPGLGYESRYEELEGLDPRDYPLIHQYKILADVAPYSKEFREARKELENHEPTGYELDMFNETEEQLKEKRKKRKFREEVYEETALGRYGSALIDMARLNPLEQLTPISPAHKFLPQTTALNAYEETIYGKEFKLWQRPIDDYVKPFLATVGNLTGLDEIPEDVREARKIEQYFDELKYVKFRRLEQRAMGDGDNKRAKYYRGEWSRTLTGLDPYSDEKRLLSSLPKREKDFYEAFRTSKPEEREKILELAPKNLRDIYIAQWDKALLVQDSKRGIEGTEEELQGLEENILNRMNKTRSRRKMVAENVEESSDLPDKDWIGWNKDVDLEDVKLKYLLGTGRDHHYYDLWDDRLKSLRRKPYLEEATEQLNPFGEQRVEESYAETYQRAVEMGIRNPQIKDGGGAQDSYNLEYDDTSELNDIMRELGRAI